MKKLLIYIHETMEEYCYPIDPFPVYMFMVIALLCPLVIGFFK